MQAGIALNDEVFFLSDATMVAALAAALAAGIFGYVLLARPRALFGAKRTGGAPGRKLGTFVGVLLAVAVLVAPVLFALQDGSVLTTIPLLGVRLLQAIVLDNGFVDFIGGLPSGGLATVYYCLIGLGYLLLPILAAFNVYDLLMQRLTSVQVWRIIHLSASGKNVYLLNDFNANTNGLAQDILERDERALVIFAAMSRLERDTWSTEISELDSDRTRFLETGYPDMAVELCRPFRFRKLKCLALADSTSQNISETCRMIERLRGHSAGDERVCSAFSGDDASAKRARVHLYCTCDSADDELVLDAANGSNLSWQANADAAAAPLQLTTLNEAALATYTMLHEHPLHMVLQDPPASASGLRPGEPTRLDVLVVGSGRYAEEVVKGALWCGQMYNVGLHVRAVGDGAGVLRDRMLMRYPELGRSPYFELAFDEVAVQSPAFDDLVLARYRGAEHLYVVVAIEDDALSYEIALHTRLFFLGACTGTRVDVDNHPLITCLIKDEAMSGLIATQFDEDVPGFGLIPFGCRRTLFGYEGIIDSSLERAGQFAADVYDALYNGIDQADFSSETVSVPTLKQAVEGLLASGALPDVATVDERVDGIACLPQIRHYSNLALALHSRYKAWALDGRALSDEACEQLGRNEHDRWAAFYQTQGFSYMDPAEQEMYSRELPGKNTRHKIEPLRKHALMCPYDEIWANYLHAKGGFSYLDPANAPTGVARVSVAALADDGSVATGVRLQLLDAAYRVIESWTVDSAQHETPGLADGRYILHPVSALAGRACAPDRHFEVRGGVACVNGEELQGALVLKLSGAPLVNPTVHDQAFAVAATKLSQLA